MLFTLLMCSLYLHFTQYRKKVEQKGCGHTFIYICIVDILQLHGSWPWGPLSHAVSPGDKALLLLLLLVGVITEGQPSVSFMVNEFIPLA